MSNKTVLDLATAAEKITFTAARTTVINNTKLHHARSVCVSIEGNETLPMRGVSPRFSVSDMEKRVLRAVRGHTVGLNVSTYVWNSWGDIKVGVVFTFPAQSAKKIVSEAYAWGKVSDALDLPDEYSTLEDLIAGTVRKCIADEAERILALERSEQAQEFAARIANHCDKLARQRCKFDERVAALKAEVAEQRVACVEEVLAEIPERGSDGTVDPRVMAEAKSLVPVKVGEWKPGYRFLRGNDLG